MTNEQLCRTQYPAQIACQARDNFKHVLCKNLQFLWKEIEISRVLIDARAAHRSTRSRESRAPAHAIPGRMCAARNTHRTAPHAERI